MRHDQTDKDFVTPGRITLATNYATDLAENEPQLSAAACADKAVRRVFGRWLIDPTAAIRPERLPLYCKLVSRVESQMGVHRAPTRRTAPWRPSPKPSAIWPHPGAAVEPEVAAARAA